MSTRVMAECWPIKTEPSRKAVLVSLADQANDDGVCWPSVGTIAERTCLDERTVQRAIQALQDEGHLTIQMRPGRSTVYRLHPRHRVTPNPRHGDTPTPGTVSPTPGTVSPHPRHGDTQNRKGTIKEPSERGDAPVGATSDRGSRIPDGFPTEAEVEWARAERTDLDPVKLAEKFRDFWKSVPGQRGRKADWPATWRVFVRNEFATRAMSSNGMSDDDLARLRAKFEEEERRAAA